MLTTEATAVRTEKSIVNKSAYNEVLVGWDAFFDAEELELIPGPQKKKKFKKRVWSFPSLYVPKINKNYIFAFSTDFRKLFNYLLTDYRVSQLPYLYGPHGCGKTSGPVQIAAILGREIRQVYVSPTTEAADLYGSWQPTKDGGAKFVDGVLITAMRKGQWCIINEFDLLDAAQQKELNQMFEERRLELPNGKVVEADKNFRLIITANTNGYSGDVYESRNSDPSVLDRFFFIKCDYLSQEKETIVLKKIARNLLENMKILSETQDSHKLEFQRLILGQIDNLIIPNLVKFSDNIRSSYKKSLLGVGSFDAAYPLSQRTLIEWLCQTIEDFFWETDTQNAVHNSVKSGFEYSFCQSLNPEHQQGYKDIFNDFFGDKLKAAA